jgi:hypothetical protein
MKQKNLEDKHFVFSFIKLKYEKNYVLRKTHQNSKNFQALFYPYSAHSIFKPLLSFIFRLFKEFCPIDIQNGRNIIVPSY